MPIRELAEVGARLEEAVKCLAQMHPSDERYELYEEIAIAILGSEHQQFAPGALEAYLKHYLSQLSRTLLIPAPQRTAVSVSIFGIDFPMTVEPYIFHMADSMPKDYKGVCVI